MPKSSRKISSPRALASALTELVTPHRAGMPARDAIVGVTTPLAGTKFSVIHTNELDAYEKAAKGPPFAAAAAAALPTGDEFSGTSRKAAKLSISTAKTEIFKDVKDLIGSLPADSKMVFHKPPIGTDATSNRVKEEQRNVRVSAFLYAASREADNDFHLIIGRDPKTTPEIYMTMELSGLPPASEPSFKQLKAARDAFKKFFKTQAGGNLPGLTYDFYQPPIPVQIEGSLFFDMSHASGQRPGPPSLKSRMPVIWEVHPITVFKA